MGFQGKRHCAMWENLNPMSTFSQNIRDGCVLFHSFLY